MTLDQKTAISAVDAWAARVRREADYLSGRLAATGSGRDSADVQVLWALSRTLCSDVSDRVASLAREIDTMRSKLL